jgi:signal transduction histidine kinase
LQKILSNLYSNAIKYAKSDIQVVLSAIESDNKFRIEIANDGFLIPHDLREKIFEPFFRIKETNMHEGTGIGLALSRTLAELNKATLMLKETDNGMNVFVFEGYVSHETDRVDSVDQNIKNA